MIRAEIVEAILNERHRQKAEGYADTLDPLEWNAVICEEAGELAQAILDWHRSDSDDDLLAMKVEAVQLAAACVAFLEDWS